MARNVARERTGEEMDNISNFIKAVIDAKAKQNKIIYVSKSEYDSLIGVLGHVPSNLKINNFVPERQAIVVDQNELNKMSNPNGLTKF